MASSNPASRSASPDDSGEGGTGPAPPPAGTLRAEPGEQLRDLIEPQPRAAEPGVDWRGLFDAPDPRDLLVRLAEGDPLGLRARGIRFLQRRALVLHADRLHIRNLALVAFKGLLYTGRPRFEDWLGALIAQGATDLVRQDLEAELSRHAIDTRDEVCFGFLTEAFGVEPGQARRLGVRFNLQPEDTRRVLWRSVFEGRPVADLGAEGEERLRAGLAVLSAGKPITYADLAELGSYDREETP